MPHAKDIFVVHTRSIDVHRELHEKLSGMLDAVGLSIWQYQDWEWRRRNIERDSRFSDDAADLMSDVDKEIFGYRSPRQVSGDVDRDTLNRLLRRTPVVLVFELPGPETTDGVREEVRIVDKELDRLFPSGHFGLIRFGADGYFSRRYPMHCGAILDVGSATSVSTELLDRVALFAVQMLMRKDMVSLLWTDQSWNEALERLNEWVERIRQGVARWDFMTRIGPDELIIELVGDALSWMVSLERALGTRSFWTRAGALQDWLTNGFNGVCNVGDLHEQHLLNLIRLLAHLGPDGRAILREIVQKPVYRENANTAAVSWEALVASSRALAAVDGLREADPIIGMLTSGDDLDHMTDVLIQGLGRVAEQGDSTARQRAKGFLRELIAGERVEQSSIAHALSAFGRLAEPSDAAWLRALISGRMPEESRLQALIALMRAIRTEACELVTDFITQARPRERRTIGSVAWMIDRDQLYDALLGADPQDEKMIGVVLHALIRAGNGRALTEANRCLRSQSSYLQTVAVVMIPQICNRCQLPDRKKYELGKAASAIVEHAKGLAHFGAVASCIRCSVSSHKKDADELLRISLGRGQVKRARSLLLDGGLGLPDWPTLRELRLLLFHPAAIIRGTAAFVAGIQRRSSVQRDLEFLESDPSEVAGFSSTEAMKDIGNTVSQSARLALERISGHGPPVRLNTW